MNELMPRVQHEGAGPFSKGNNPCGAMCISRKALFARTSLQCSKDGKRTRIEREYKENLGSHFI